MKHLILLLLCLCFSIVGKAQFMKLEHYPQIPVEYDGAFVDCVKGFVTKVLPSAYGQYFGQVTITGDIYGYGAFFTDQDGEVTGQFRNGTCFFGIRIGSQTAKVGTEDHYIVYDLRTGDPLHVIKGDSKFTLPADYKEKYRFESFTYSNGDKYVGETVDGKRHGYGLYYYVNGNYYYGRYKENLQYGYGAMFRTDSRIVIMDWESKNED